MRFLKVFVVFVLFLSFLKGCGEIKGNFDQLKESGEIEKIARKRYSSFFRAVRNLDDLRSKGEKESSRILTKAARATDRVISDLRDFPHTMESRLAFEALSFSAGNLLDSPSYTESDVRFFWNHALIDPLLYKAREYLESSRPNDSTHLQIILGMRSALGETLSDEIISVLMTIIGPNPSDAVIAACERDAPVLRKITDLLFYTRSLQESSPPLWMCTGPWFIAVETEDWPRAFFCVRPYFAEDEIYLSFRSYTYPEIYNSLFDEPLRLDSEDHEELFEKVRNTVQEIKIDPDFARRIVENEPPTFDCHFFHDDYLLSTSVRGTDMMDLSFKLEEVRGSEFNVVGMDSIRITLSAIQPEVSSGLYQFEAYRYHAETVIGENRHPARSTTGRAYMFPFGTHSYDIINRFQELREFEITVE